MKRRTKVTTQSWSFGGKVSFPPRFRQINHKFRLQKGLVSWLRGFAVKRIVEHLNREKRRLYSIAFLAFSAGCVLYSHVDATRLGLPLPVLAGFIYMGLIVCASAITSYFLPKLTRVTDAVAVTRLGFALWIASTQNYELAASPMIGATIVVGGAAILLQVRSWVQVAHQNVLETMSPAFAFDASPQRIKVPVT